MLFEKVEVDEDGVLLNSYHKFNPTPTNRDNKR